MKAERICVVGLGYVGLPLAVALAKRFDTVGLDVDPRRIEELKAGNDRTGEVEPDALKASGLILTCDSQDCAGADFFIITVPTPVDAENRPDLGALAAASRTVGGLLRREAPAIVVYESTVYPGVTEEICGPILEAESGLACGRDFFLGYSPERINPGDREHRVDSIVKVIAGQTPEVVETLARVYGAVTSAGTFRAASIKAAEAAKVIENSQRDINIAFMNEITRIFERLDLSIWDVLDAAATKWNFLRFEPGLVGGHCIGVDPFYLAHRASELGHDPQVILAGRATNDGMGRWIAERLHERREGRAGSALILGVTFKEDVPDLRNSKVIDVVRRLSELGHQVSVHDPLADAGEAVREYEVTLDAGALDRTYDLVVAAVGHEAYRAMEPERIAALASPGGTIADIKGLWRGKDLGATDRWSL